jgi:hypothetical protein
MQFRSDADYMIVIMMIINKSTIWSNNKKRILPVKGKKSEQRKAKQISSKSLLNLPKVLIILL